MPNSVVKVRQLPPVDESAASRHSLYQIASTALQHVVLCFVMVLPCLTGTVAMCACSLCAAQLKL